MKSRIWFFLFWALLVVGIFLFSKKDLRRKGKELTINQSKIAIINPENLIVAKGDTFKAEIQIGIFEPLRNKTHLSINGQRIMTDENGLAEYKEKTRISGTRKLSVVVEPTSGGLTGKSSTQLIQSNI